MNTCWFKKLS